MIHLYRADILYFGNVLIVFDGDVKDSDLGNLNKGIIKNLSNIIKLPGGSRPESLLYDYLLSLAPDHQYWENAAKLGITWTYLKENGPKSEKYNQEKDRERYKKWFTEHQCLFDSTGIFDFWAEDHDELIKQFKRDFVVAYNAIADRIFARKIS